MKTCSFIISLWFFSGLIILAQSEEKKEPEKEKIKTGLTFGTVPAIAFDSDIGFKYGAVVNFYHFGDGSSYPNYKHGLFLEWSRTTKGSGINELIYDSEYLIPASRLTVEASYLTEQALDFYGFNGYNAFYEPSFAEENHINYITRMYYRQDRKMLRLRADLLRNIIGENLRFYIGFAHYGIDLSRVNFEKLNQGRDAEDLIPDTTTLYDKYVDWGFFGEDDANGGNSNLIKTGLVYDTRDIEANPMKGMWTTFQLVMAPPFLGNSEGSYLKMVLNHRQYFTLIQKVCNFAYRISYQDKLSGDIPTYMMPFIFNSGPIKTRDGLGGAKTIRGILRNRVVGEDYLYGNLEVRYKVIRRVVFNQNVYVAVNTFVDWGMVTGKYKFPDTDNPEALEYLANGDKEAIHGSYGTGINFALNENFVVAVNYGMAMDRRDGRNGLYIGLNFLY